MQVDLRRFVPHWPPRSAERDGKRWKGRAVSKFSVLPVRGEGVKEAGLTDCEDGHGDVETESRESEVGIQCE